MRRVVALVSIVLLTAPLINAQDEPATFIACDETLAFDMPDGFHIKEFAPQLDDDEAGGRIVLATHEDLLEPFVETLEAGDMHIFLSRHPAEEDIEPADYLTTFSQFEPVSLTINEQSAAVAYQQDPQTGVQQILLAMLIPEDVVLWVNATTLDNFAELELVTDTLVHSFDFGERLVDEDWRYYFTDDCRMRFEYPAAWTVTPDDQQLYVTPPDTDDPVLTIIPPDSMWAYFEDLDPALVTIDQLFNTYIERHDSTVDGEVERDGLDSWTIGMENGFMMVREYADQQVAMFIVRYANGEQIQAQIDQILASFSVNLSAD
jgi:hypothetical protein